MDVTCTGDHLHTKDTDSGNKKQSAYQYGHELINVNRDNHGDATFSSQDIKSEHDLDSEQSGCTLECGTTAFESSVGKIGQDHLQDQISSHSIDGADDVSHGHTFTEPGLFHHQDQEAMMSDVGIAK